MERWALGSLVSVIITLVFLENVDAAPAAHPDLGFTVDSKCLVGGQTTTGHVHVSEFFFDSVFNVRLPARVDLSSSNPTLVQVPNMVIVNPPGVGAPSPTQTAFDITTSAVGTPTSVDITAVHNRDGTTRIITLSLRDPSGRFLTDLDLNPDSVTGGALSIGIAQLHCVPEGGLALDVASSDPAATVIDAAGQPITQLAVEETETSIEFDIRTVPVAAATTAQISVSDGAAMQQRDLGIQPGNLDFWIRKVEVTQAIQYLDDPFGVPDNALVLLRGKPTAIRVYLEANTTTPIRNVPVGLEVQPVAGDIPGACMNPAPLWRFATVNPSASPQEQRDSPGTAAEIVAGPLNVTFVIGAECLTEGPLNFRATVNPNAILSESNHNNNQFGIGPLDFRSTPNLNIKFVRIDWCPGCPTDKNPRLKPSWEAIKPIVAYLAKVYPVDRVNVWRGKKEINVWQWTNNDFAKDGTWDGVLFRLAALKAFTDDEAPGMHYYALLHEDVPRQGGPCGKAYYAVEVFGTRVLRVGAGSTDPDCGGGSGPIAAQELGHNLMRYHAPCPLPGEDGAPDDIDARWPAGVNPRGIVGHTGFDTESSLALQGRPHSGQDDAHPNVQKDFMSYCEPKWVSPYTYGALYQQYALFSAVPAVVQPGPLVPHLMIRGVIGNGDVELAPIYQRELPAGTHEFEGRGCHALMLRDSDGQVLETRRFDPQPTGWFSEIVRGSMNVSQINVVNTCAALEPVVLGSTAVTTAEPSVRILEPNGGEFVSASDTLVVAWEASDPDSEDLSFAVLVSPDAGATWEALDVDLKDMSVQLDAAELPGTREAIVRILVSDGINSAHDDSDATFEIESKNPNVHILSPGSDVEVPLGVAVVLRGTADDVEDGPLPNEAMEWTSSIQGVLGLGTTLVVAELSLGTHVIKLEGPDSDGRRASDSMSVSIYEPRD